MSTHDLYQTITDKIITELEKGAVPWIRPWTGEADPIPRNALTQRPYRGINTVLLGLEAQCQGYGTQQWLTYRQAQQLGGQVRKGEHSTLIIYYETKLVEKAADEPLADGSEPEKRFIPLIRVFNVFNLDQIDGLPAQEPVFGSDWNPCEKAEQIIDASGALIRHSGFRAFYSPPNDLIYLPLKSAFHDEAGYYATALHELTHWSGHTSRLGRKLGRRFGESAYAMEELVAEMGAAFLSAHCHLEGRLQHASYIARWLEVLQRDKRAIFVAAAQAQKATDFLLERAGLLAPEQKLALAA